MKNRSNGKVNVLAVLGGRAQDIASGMKNLRYDGLVEHWSDISKVGEIRIFFGFSPALVNYFFKNSS